MQDRITRLVRAGFAGIYLVTPEETRAEIEISGAAEKLGYELYVWTVTRGLLNPAAGSVRDMPDPVEAVSCLSDLPEKSILVLKDFHQFLGDDSQPANPIVTRSLRDEIKTAKAKGKVVIVTACRKRIPPEIDKEFTVLEFELPDIDTLSGIARNLCESAGIDPDNDVLEAAAEAARGLTVTEAENTMALSVVTAGGLDPQIIAAEKARTIGNDGILEIIEQTVTSDDIGGLEALKNWLSKRKYAFSPEAREFGLPSPRGVLILGIPGTGKSLTAKAASSMLGKPILRLDAGKLFAGIVGESEANMRRAVQTAEAIAPCILWIDEIEKGFSGSRSSGRTDGGTSARVFGSFISWMQEKNSPVFVVATANDVSRMPPELLRKGRFDELFFVDLPDSGEREAIWRIHLSRRKRDPDKLQVKTLAKMTDGFTGSEIEQTVIDAMFDCFDAGRDVDLESLNEAVRNTVPLSVTMGQQIKSLRQWARNRARFASYTQPDSADSKRRIST